MKNSLGEMSESIRRHNAYDWSKDKSPSLPCRPISKAQMSSIRQSLSAKFCNTIGDQSGRVTTTISPESETKEKVDQVSPKKNSEEHKKAHEIECVNNVDHIINKVIYCLFVVSFLHSSLKL